MVVGVVLDDVEVVLLRQLQHAVRAGGRQAVARGVVQHAHADEQARRLARAGVCLAVARHHRQVGPVGAARHRQHAHAQRGQPRELDRPAGLLHQHRVAGAQQGAADDVQRLRGTHGGDDLRRVGVDALAGQPRGQHAAQAGVALRLAIAHGGVEQLRRRADLAHGGGHEVGAQPVGRQHAHAGLRARVGGVEHAAHQRGGADRRVQAAGVGRVAECFGFDGCARLALGRCGRPRHRVAHEEAALRPRLHQALRQQLVVGGHHGGRADPVQRRALPHAGQARAGRQQLVADALGKALGQLVGQ